MVQEARGDHKQNSKSHFAGLEPRYSGLRRDNRNRQVGMQFKRHETRKMKDIRRVQVSLAFYDKALLVR